MKYSDDGTEIRLGDRVRIYNSDTGVIVCSVDTDEYSEEFQDDWADTLKSGVLVRTDIGALVHIEYVEEDKDPKKIVRLPADWVDPDGDNRHCGFPKLSP